MEDQARAAFLRTIRANIATHGRHITLVQGGPLPRFAYTIGAAEGTGVELVLAGAAHFQADDVRRILNDAAEVLEAADRQESVELAPLGAFTLRPVDATWNDPLLLGVQDFHGARVPAVQLVPERRYRTIDIPDMSQPWDAATEPVWRWLHEPWSHPVSSQSVATTNLAALQGHPITEGARWSDTEWELFAGFGPEVHPEEVRTVPLATLLAADLSLAAMTELPVGEGLWREEAGCPWNAWRQKPDVPAARGDTPTSRQAPRDQDGEQRS